MKIKRAFWIVLDSFGIGELPDAAAFGDEGSNTLRACAETGLLDIPNMIDLGLGNIEGVSCIKKSSAPAGAFGRFSEASLGKDTTTGHWELAGLVSEKPFPTYPDGFPKEVIDGIIEEGLKQGIKPKDKAEQEQTEKMVAMQMKALIARDLWTMTEYFRVTNESNDFIKCALERLDAVK